MTKPNTHYILDLAIIGGGAAGLAAGYFAGQAAAGRGLKIAVLEGGAKPGIKILASGGGRCNLTNRDLGPEHYAGGSPNFIRKVLRSFDQHATLEWMRGELGVQVELEEETGKYFPRTQKAGTVLAALLAGLERGGVSVMCGQRVEQIRPAENGEGYELKTGAGWAFSARRLIVATGGLALPKSGSDGAGLSILEALGHKLVPTTPALCPLVLAPGARLTTRLTALSGITLDARLGIYERQSGRALAETQGAVLLTHLGLSGPAAMDLSRHIARAQLDGRGEQTFVALGHPSFKDPAQADAWLQEAARRHPRRSTARMLEELWPARLAELLGEGQPAVGQLTREGRGALARGLARLELPVAGDRGYALAESTAGGVCLTQVNAATMESRVRPGLYLCGELLDADGRIGGYNFQWAWATARLAARAATTALWEEKNNY